MQIPEESRGWRRFGSVVGWRVWVEGLGGGFGLEVFIPPRKLLICLGLVAGKTVKVDVARTLGGAPEIHTLNIPHFEWKIRY